MKNTRLEPLKETKQEGNEKLLLAYELFHSLGIQGTTGTVVDVEDIEDIRAFQTPDGDVISQKNIVILTDSGTQKVQDTLNDVRSLAKARHQHTQNISKSVVDGTFSRELLGDIPPKAVMEVILVAIKRMASVLPDDFQGISSFEDNYDTAMQRIAMASRTDVHGKYNNIKLLLIARSIEDLGVDIFGMNRKDFKTTAAKVEVGLIKD